MESGPPEALAAELAVIWQVVDERLIKEFPKELVRGLQ